MNKATRATIKLSGIPIEVFQLPPSGNYVMSQSQVAKAVDVHKSTISRWLSTQESGLSLLQNLNLNDVQDLPGKDYRCYKIGFDSEVSSRRGGNGKINIVSIQLASEFWMEQALKGNQLAISLAYACLEESLKRRCDSAFDIQMTDDIYEDESIDVRSKWLESRSYCKDAHISFMNCCKYNGFNAAIAHNEITKRIVGKTAKELREDELINGDYRVGLNHVDQHENLVRIAQVKLQFSRYGKGNVFERVKRALKEKGISYE